MSKEIIQEAMRRYAKGGGKRAKTVTMSAPGKEPITFKKGALHRALGVPEGEPIPAGKKAAALAGKLGAKIKKMAVFGFRGALAAGRKTAAKG